MAWDGSNGPLSANPPHSGRCQSVGRPIAVGANRASNGRVRNAEAPVKTNALMDKTRAVTFNRCDSSLAEIRLNRCFAQPYGYIAMKLLESAKKCPKGG